MKKQLLSLIAAGALLSGMQLFAAPQNNENTPCEVNPALVNVIAGGDCDQLKKLFPSLPAVDCENDSQWNQRRLVTAARLYKWFLFLTSGNKGLACELVLVLQAVQGASCGASFKAFCPPKD